MRKDLPPGVVASVLILVFVVLGLLYWKAAGPRGKAEEMEAAIRATVIKGPLDMPGAAGPNLPAAMPVPPSGKAKPAPAVPPSK